METIEPWRRVWRNGIAPQLSGRQLYALHTALKINSGTLTQETVVAPLVSLDEYAEVEQCCPSAFPGLMAGCTSVYELFMWWKTLCNRCDLYIAEKGTMAQYLNWESVTPRDVMRRELLAECTLALAMFVKTKFK